MNENIIGIIVCVSVIVCGLCTYFIGLTQGIKMALKRLVEEDEQMVHGHWIKIGSQYSIRNMKCSICGEEVFGDVDTEKYCFNCGAKMDKEE